MSNRRINVRSIIWHNNKLLAVKHLRSDGSEAEYWALPGGGLDPYESIEEGVAREIHEEFGIPAKVGRLLFMQQFRSGRGNYDEELEFFFHVENPEDFEVIDLASTTHGSDEIARVEFIDPSKEYILPAFLASIAIGDYVHNIKPPYIYTDELTQS